MFPPLFDIVQYYYTYYCNHNYVVKIIHNHKYFSLKMFPPLLAIVQFYYTYYCNFLLQSNHFTKSEYLYNNSILETIKV